jgi:hypothetical protein
MLAKTTNEITKQSHIVSLQIFLEDEPASFLLTIKAEDIGEEDLVKAP